MGSSQKIEIYEKKPLEFKALVEIAACYVEIEGKILLLQQSLAKKAAGAWGVPAGKIEKDETAEAAAQRELFEETGIQIEKPNQIQALGCLYICETAFHHVFHLFQIKLEKKPSISISHEHQAFGWFPMQNIHTLPLIPGAQEAMAHYQRRASEIKRSVNRSD